ncbi:MAG: hypothetical protein FRX49_00640 [Trebouxia sp. A1-2]|nr:MAG: hypothetical protein FRX49_00640 [Trebouxia sp. A1-2]
MAKQHKAKAGLHVASTMHVATAVATVGPECRDATTTWDSAHGPKVLPCKWKMSFSSSAGAAVAQPNLRPGANTCIHPFHYLQFTPFLHGLSVQSHVSSWDAESLETVSV